MPDRPSIPPEQWGRDHFSTLLYVETRVVDNRGILFASPRESEILRQRGKYPTLLREGSIEDHGDMDCIADMRAAGLLSGCERSKIRDYHRGNGPNPAVEPYSRIALAPAGWRLAHLLRMRKADGLPPVPPVEDVLAIVGRPEGAL
jgi:hypothetical protein